MRNILVFVSILLWACSCEDDSLKQLPPATQEGKNTFGCLIDGEVFMANRGGLFSSAIGVEYLAPDYFRTSGSGSLNSCEDDDVSHIYLYINDSSIISIGDIIYLGSNFRKSGSVIKCGTEFKTFNEYSGELEITKLDTLNKIISGTYWFDAKSEEGEVVEIRDGRFDINYIPTR